MSLCSSASRCRLLKAKLQALGWKQAQLPVGLCLPSVMGVVGDKS